MQRIEYRTVDKSGWERGPWDDEPDKVQWQDEATDLPCLIRRSPLGGNWCGYVGVLVDHPWHGKYYGDVEVDVHGGLSYASECDDGPPETSICHVTEEHDRVWWFGFDCAHLFDLKPAMVAREQALGMPPMADEIYRDQAYVENEVRSLAKQLSAVVP